ncbi:DUF3768 domain-containing protein [Falsiroseomonas sp. E2-1-a20]|uniref:DUF3768 domain-containing protein n=1 Tax=Falsiroseomonas sp. E2-1-a20 TaxID=3239300 RepID=UPI003F3C2B19
MTRSPLNDPHQEHDCGLFEAAVKRLIFQIDYYELDFTAMAHDPTDPRVTRCVLTIMLASEY